MIFILCVALVVVSAHDAIFSWRKDRIIADLLDRLMCRNFQDYAQVRTAVKNIPRKRVLTDEELAALEENNRGGN